MIDFTYLQQYIDQGYITRRKHPTADLYILNYTAKAQFDRLWNELTLTCRGLIVDANNNFIARPFPKFFNLEQHQAEDMPNVPDLPYQLFEKMDGSLGILFWVNGEAAISTRGSFESEQAIMATQILHSKYGKILAGLDQSKTYLFEIIYPENRIVVDYGDFRDLVLLEVIDTATGTSCEVGDIGFSKVREYHPAPLSELKDSEVSNKEGYVARFANGFRVKIKFGEYVRLHRILTGINKKWVWDILRNGDNLDGHLKDVPDEFYQWVQEVKGELEEEFKTQFESYNSRYVAVFNQRDTTWNRKEFAAYAKQFEHPAILFHLLDGKDVIRLISEMVWGFIKPEFETPFRLKK